MGTDVRLGAMDGVFTVAGVRPARDGMTISRDAGLGSENTVTFFALGAGTSISRERYDMTSMYIGALGEAVFLTGDDAGRQSFLDGDMLIVPGGTLCGVESGSGAVYTEIIIKKEINMNNLVKAGEVMKLKNLIQYEEGSISNLDIVSNPTMKFVLMAFDEGTGLQPHRAPGNAIIFALEGKAVIGYEGKDYTISAGENFRFEKNGLHSVTADGKFKMALLLVIE
jgi:quercetin dioxygenase-like cupin family protein